MVIKFECTCGNKDPNETKIYDGSLGYEAIICKKCRKIYDINTPEGFYDSNFTDVILGKRR